jgi:hypothetical protein
MMANMMGGNMTDPTMGNMMNPIMGGNMVDPIMGGNVMDPMMHMMGYMQMQEMDKIMGIGSMQMPTASTMPGMTGIQPSATGPLAGMQKMQEPPVRPAEMGIQESVNDAAMNMPYPITGGFASKDIEEVKMRTVDISDIED